MSAKSVSRLIKDLEVLALKTIGLLLFINYYISSPLSWDQSLKRQVFVADEYNSADNDEEKSESDSDIPASHRHRYR
jgi:hypothetical protein